MNFLWRDETLFRDESVFDPEYIPETLIHRERQMMALAMNLRPALRNSSPIHTILFGPPATGKTSTLRTILREIDDHAIITYVRCPLARTSYRVFSRIFERVYGYPPPHTGISIARMYELICEGLLERNKPLIVALDDFNFLERDAGNEILYALLKAHEEYSIRIGIILVTTERIELDEKTGAVFHPDEIYFPLYDEDEIRDILLQRIRLGFYDGVIADEAFERIVELTARTSDLRFGIYLLRMSGIEAERRASRRIELRDVEMVYEGGARVFLAKSISALNSDEREALKIIYSIEGDVNSGDIYRILKAEVNMGYTRFYEIINKLERLRLIDVVMGKKGRGRTRYIIRRYDRELMLKALMEG